MKSKNSIRSTRKPVRLSVEHLESRQVPAVIISEIMYNPASTEGPPPNRVEWVELYNNGVASESLAAAYLTDVTEGGRTGRSGSFTTTIPANGVVVLFPDSIALADFRGAWGPNVSGVPVGKWGRNCPALDLCLRNSTGTSDGEHLQLHRSDGTIIDEVNDRTTSPWPQLTTQGGPSIYLKASALNSIANDDPVNWAKSQNGFDGAWNSSITPIFDRIDTGSPGRISSGSILVMASGTTTWRTSVIAGSSLQTTFAGVLSSMQPPVPIPFQTDSGFVGAAETCRTQRNPSLPASPINRCHPTTIAPAVDEILDRWDVSGLAAFDGFSFP